MHISFLVTKAAARSHAVDYIVVVDLLIIVAPIEGFLCLLHVCCAVLCVLSKLS